MFKLIRTYTHWLHTRWPAGTVESLPRVREDFSTNVPGLYVVGDLTGIPLLKFAADSGTRAVRAIAADPSFHRLREEEHEAGEEILDLVIIGGGVSGMAAALEAKRLDLTFRQFESSVPFSTIVNFPKGKHIFTYPTEMRPAGDLQFTADVKEPLVEELRAQTLEKGIEPEIARVSHVNRKGKVLEVNIPASENVLARRVVVAIGRSGNFRKLNVPGESFAKVSNRLHDPKDFAGKRVCVVGGGDSALEAAIAIAQCGGDVTISYRKHEFSRPKPENLERLSALMADPEAMVEVEQPSSEREGVSVGEWIGPRERRGSIILMMGSRPREITDDAIVIVDGEGKDHTLPNDTVFAMIGREPPLDFFRRSRVKIHGETQGLEWLAIAAFFVAIFLVYDWKSHGFLAQSLDFLSSEVGFPKAMPAWIASLGDWWHAQVEDRSTVIGTLAVSMKSRSFYYTLAYTAAIAIFGFLRVRRRKTPYVKVQTTVLFLVQAIPLFLLPELILPWMDYNGWFRAGLGKVVADNLFELYISEEAHLAELWPEWGHPRAHWRAYGFILAWPLMVYNIFTEAPMMWWLIIGFVQTFVIIPLLIWRWGKGAYCGWICSCGGLAETLGDTQRHKMPHGPLWNRINMLGQGLLLIAFALLVIRIWGWIDRDSWAHRQFALLLHGKTKSGMVVNPIAWKWVVDVSLGGIIGVGLYFKYSGRVWCRFACPLAALMHIYARFSRFAILAEKKKCISCNVCTSVCHQGIDIMNFANKGLPMRDPQCVRCSACVQSCPTGVLQFGQMHSRTGETLSVGRLAASSVRMGEAKAGPADR